MPKRLNQYKGKLTPAQVAEGINAAEENAKRLAEDAEILLNAARYSTAASIAALAIEEAGKVSILRSIALARDDKELKQAWRDYRSHTKKNVAWLLPQLVAQGARKLEDFRPLFDEHSDHPHVLDQVKQIGLYTDCLGSVNWSQPSEVVNAELATMLVSIAKLLSNRKHRTTEEEIEMWVKHLAPVWKTNMALMRHGLLTWHEEMVERGLKPDDDMLEFVAPGTNDKDV